MKKILIIVLIALVLFFTAGILFVKLGTRAVNKNDTKEVIFEIHSGDSRNAIVKNLKSAGLIKNKLAA